MKKSMVLLIIVALLAGLFLLGAFPTAQAQEAGQPTEEMIALGKALFFDSNLSANGKQSCASCHAPEVGFTGPDSAVNASTVVYEGAIPHRFGNRKPPASSYGGESPTLYYDETLGEWVGGMFWDGRATGAILGDPLAEQAQGPFLNPLEQAMPTARVVVAKVASSPYASLFEQVWGPGSLSMRDVEGAYERIARSIAAYERSAEANRFSSRFDRFWDNAAAAGKDVTQIHFGGGLGMGGSGMDCGQGGMGGGGMGGGMDPGMMCNPDLFPPPEVDQNLTPMNHFNMMDQANILAFLKTLSDDYQP